MLMTQTVLRAALNAVRAREADASWPESFPGERKALATAVRILTTHFERRRVADTLSLNGRLPGGAAPVRDPMRYKGRTG